MITMIIYYYFYYWHKYYKYLLQTRDCGTAYMIYNYIYAPALLNHTASNRNTVALQTAEKKPLQQFLTAKYTVVTSMLKSTPPIGAPKQLATPTAHAAASISVFRDSFSQIPLNEVITFVKSVAVMLAMCTNGPCNFSHKFLQLISIVGTSPVEIKYILS